MPVRAILAWAARGWRQRVPLSTAFARKGATAHALLIRPCYDADRLYTANSDGGDSDDGDSDDGDFDGPDRLYTANRAFDPVASLCAASAASGRLRAHRDPPPAGSKPARGQQARGASSDQLSSDQLRFDQLSSDQLRFDQLSFDQLRFDQLRFDRLGPAASTGRSGSTRGRTGRRRARSCSRRARLVMAELSLIRPGHH